MFRRLKASSFPVTISFRKYPPRAGTIAVPGCCGTDPRWLFFVIPSGKEPRDAQGVPSAFLFEESVVKRNPPVVIGSQRVRVQVARQFRSHPVFRVPTDRPKKIVEILKRLRGSVSRN